MNRIVRITIAVWMGLVMIGPAAAGGLPVASLSPNSGLAGSEITVTVSQYSPNIPIEVRENDENGALIGMGATGDDGTGSFQVTIPETYSNGSHLLYICGLCTAQFPEWATRGFTVTGPAASTTTTAGPTTTTVATTTPTTAAPTTAATPASTDPATTAGGDVGDEPTSESDSESSRRGLLIGAIVALAVILAVIVGVLIGSTSTNRQQPPPAPPPAP
jgi:hypothetical protein